jgi:hypothetical protein
VQTQVIVCATLVPEHGHEYKDEIRLIEAFAGAIDQNKEIDTSSSSTLAASPPDRLDVIELSVGGGLLGPPCRVLSFAARTRVALLESILRGDEVASLATVAAAEPLTWKWSKLLRLPFPTSAVCLRRALSGSFERRPQHGQVHPIPKR